jgi:hypothetical protein
MDRGVKSTSLRDLTSKVEPSSSRKPVSHSSMIDVREAKPYPVEDLLNHNLWPATFRVTQPCLMTMLHL